MHPFCNPPGDLVRSSLSLGERRADRGTGGRDVFERGGGREVERLLELRHQLVRVEGVEQVDVARSAVGHLERERAADRARDRRRLLVRVAPVFERHLVGVRAAHDRRGLAELAVEPSRDRRIVGGLRRCGEVR